MAVQAMLRVTVVSTKMTCATATNFGQLCLLARQPRALVAEARGERASGTIKAGNRRCVVSLSPSLCWQAWRKSGQEHKGNNGCCVDDAGKVVGKGKARRASCALQLSCLLLAWAGCFLQQQRAKEPPQQ